MLVLDINEELQPIILLAQILKQYFLRLAVGLLHVVDQELREIASHDPAGMFAQRHVGYIALGLLKGIQHRAVALKNTFAQVFAQRFLFDKHAGGGNMPIDKVGLIHFHLLFIADKGTGILNPEYLCEQLCPEQLRVALLRSAPSPSLGEFLGCCSHLFLSLHT